MITTIYHVTVDVPDSVWKHFRNDQIYFCEVCEAFKGNVGSGTNHYDQVEEWADFHDSSVAVAAEAKAKALMVKYEHLAKVLEEQAEEGYEGDH
ncbi:TPA: hypothetical protein ACLMYU_005270 [Pseudomonas aeruginosa]